MNSRSGSALIEIIIACFISVIVIPAVISMILCSTVLVQTSKESLVIEMLKEEVISLLASDCKSYKYISNNSTAKITELSAFDGYVKLQIDTDNFRGRKKCFVFWPRSGEKK